MNIIFQEKLRKKSIGYIPVSKDFSSAGDRRRFLLYANHHDLNWEIADPKKDYDILYITTMGDISVWMDYKKQKPHTILIFDINNDFFFNKDILWNFARGITRYISNRESRLYFNYNNVYHEMFEIADFVVCPTLAAKEYILKYNSSVHVAFDYFEDEISTRKSNYCPQKPLTLVWEGMGVTAKHILSISSVLENFKGKVKLRLITDKTYTLGGLMTIDVIKLFNKAKFDYEFFDWEKETFSNLITESDIAVIPLDKSDTLAYQKPENKLILFWQHGLPTITSDTPEYVNAFSKTNLNLTCKDQGDWIRHLEFFLSGEFNYDEHMNSVQEYLIQNRSKDCFMRVWDEIFLGSLHLSESLSGN